MAIVGDEWFKFLKSIFQFITIKMMEKQRPQTAHIMYLNKEALRGEADSYFSHRAVREGRLKKTDAVKVSLCAKSKLLNKSLDLDPFGEGEALPKKKAPLSKHVKRSQKLKNN